MKKYFALLVTAVSLNISAAVRPDAPTDFKAVLHFDEENTYVSLSLQAPTKGSENYEEKELTSITSLTIVRSSTEADEMELPIVTFENPSPGESLAFDDTNEFTLGCTYTYTARCKAEGRDSFGATISLFVGVRPAVPEITYTTGEKGEAPIKITIGVPDKDADGNQLASPLTTVILERTGSGSTVTLKKFTSFEEGGTVNYTDREAASGEEYTYAAFAETAFGKSDAASFHIMIGADTPGAPADLSAVSDGDGGATITWEAPAKGVNSGWIDPAETRYNIYRITKEGTKELATGLDKTTFIDKATDLDKEIEAAYRVVSCNSLGGNAQTTTTGAIVIGPAARLPYYESFYGTTGYYGEPVNVWSTSPDTYWEISNSTNWTFYIEGVRAMEAGEDDGYASTYFSSFNSDPKTDDLTSGRLNLGEAAYPVVSFYSVPLTTGCSLELQIVDADGNAATIGKTDLNDGAPADGGDYTWKRFIYPIGDLTGNDDIRLRFHACSADNASNNTYIFIDEVLVDDYPPVVLPEAEAGNDGTVTFSWADPSTASQKVTSYTLTLNGETLAEPTAETSLAISGEDGKTYTLSVTANYGDIASLPSGECTATAEVAGIYDITVDPAVLSVEYFNLQGVRIANPAKAGEIVVRRAVCADGSVKTEKLTVK